jgi:hypothetical protein
MQAGFKLAAYAGRYVGSLIVRAPPNKAISYTEAACIRVTPEQAPTFAEARTLVATITGLRGHQRTKLLVDVAGMRAAA